MTSPTGSSTPRECRHQNEAGLLCLRGPHDDLRHEFQRRVAGLDPIDAYADHDGSDTPVNGFGTVAALAAQASSEAPESIDAKAIDAKAIDAKANRLHAK